MKTAVIIDLDQVPICVVGHQKVNWLFVLFDCAKSPQWFCKNIVGHIVVHGRDLADVFVVVGL